MSTTTIEDELAEVRARIERLRAIEQAHDAAEQSLAADLSEDWASFVASVEAELRRWDDYLERLQTSVAEKAWKVREQAEAAIGDVRSRRIEVDERLVWERDAAGVAAGDARKRITAARDELEQKADELSAKLT
jgi:hypothetical protein